MQGKYKEQYKLEGKRINDLLYKISKRAALMELHIEGLDESHITTINNLDQDAGLMILDVPPGDIQKSNLINRNISIYGEIDGVAYSFVSRFTDTPLAVITPNQIFYMQRRADFRVHVGLGEGLAINLPTDNGDKIKGSVRNLSAGGLGIELQLNNGNISEWYNGQCLENCELIFRTNDYLRFKLKLCHIEFYKNNYCYIGAEFLDLTPKDKRRLRMYVMDLERDHNRLSSKKQD